MSSNLPGVYPTINATSLSGTPTPDTRSALIFGTAEKGEIGSPVLITSLNDLHFYFGEAEDLASDGTATLTLVRATEMFLKAQGGTGFAYCVRIDEDSAVANHSYPNSDSNVKKGDVQTLQTGQWWNDHLTFQVDRKQFFGDSFNYATDGLLQGQWVSYKHMTITDTLSQALLDSAKTTSNVGKSYIASESAGDYTIHYIYTLGSDLTYTETVPFENMVVYEEDADQYQLYDTSDWTTTFLSNSTIASESTDVLFNDYSFEVTYDGSDDTYTMFEFATDQVVEIDTDYPPVLSIFSNISDITGAPTFQIWLEDSTGEYRSSTITVTPDAASQWQKREVDLTVTDLTDGNYFTFRRVVMKFPDNVNTPVLNLDYLTMHRKDYAIVKVLFDNEVVETYGTVDDPVDGTLGDLATELANSSYIEVATGYTASGKLIPTIRDSVAVSQYASYTPAFTTGTNIGASIGSDDWSASSDEYQAFSTYLTQNVNADGYYVILAGKTAQEGSGYYISQLSNFLDNSLSEEIYRMGLIGTELKGSSTYMQFHNKIVAGAQSCIRTDGRIIYVAQGGTYETDTVSGAWYCSSVAGTLSQNKASYSLTNKRAYGLTDVEYAFSSSLRELQQNNGALPLKKVKGVVKYEAGYTASNQTSAFRHISTVQIVDDVTNSLVTGLDRFVGELNTTEQQSAANSSASAILSNKQSENYIKAGWTSRVYATRQDEIDGIMTAEVNIQPILSIIKIPLRINLS